MIHCYLILIDIIIDIEIFLFFSSILIFYYKISVKQEIWLWNKKRVLIFLL